ncbi:hypothetical protein EZV62_002802 [Acer yangbiense]|uniref:SHSP domain-containing protein n=1 Tax=Acer yangbiense TaxID=1000413 RepID=A0A5C7IYD9_9ROSI|nr:hypothetical protein EZV62_002802 [Acer yangbiense]
MAMMMIPSFFGNIPNNNNSSSLFDPFSFDVWDPFQDFRFPSISSQFPQETFTGFINTRVDWKETAEAHVLKADLPGMKKEEVKVEVEDDRVILISGERNVDKTRTTRGIVWSKAEAGFRGDSGCRGMLR